MLRRLGGTVLKAAIGAAGGAFVMVVAGKVVGMFAASCTVACDPQTAATLGAVTGAIVSSMQLGSYKPG